LRIERVAIRLTGSVSGHVMLFNVFALAGCCLFLYIASSVFTNFIRRCWLLWCCHLEKPGVFMYRHYTDVGCQHSDDAQRTDRDYIPTRALWLFFFQTVKRSYGDRAVPYSMFKPVLLLGIK